jgi:hypothetical protein
LAIAGKPAARDRDQRILFLERHHRPGDLRQHRRGIAAGSADEQDMIGRRDPRLGEQPAGRERRIMPPPADQRQQRVAIGDARDARGAG